jgi:hypothetical protein
MADKAFLPARTWPKIFGETFLPKSRRRQTGRQMLIRKYWFECRAFAAHA